MSKTHTYPGLREALSKMFSSHPNSVYSLDEIDHEIRKLYPKHTPSRVAMGYHLGKMRDAKMISGPRGKYQWNPDYQGHAEKAELLGQHLAAGGGLQANTNGASTGLLPSNGVFDRVDLRYHDHLGESFELLKQRMRSRLPANEIFYDQDARLLDRVFAELMEATLSDVQRETVRRRARSQVAVPATPSANGVPVTSKN